MAEYGISSTRGAIEEDDLDDESATLFTLEVGRRLRSVRKQHGLSLQQVEKKSNGRWSASAIGAYERGFRILSLPRLHELARFYNVPMAVLLGRDDSDVPDGGVAMRRVVIDLVALDSNNNAPGIAGYLRHIAHKRGDWNGAVLSIRDSDMWAIAALMDTDEEVLLSQLNAAGVLR